jgi:hypothetical protein
MMNKAEECTLECAGTGDDIDELVRNSSLTTTVVLQLQVADHVSCVLGCIIHSVSSGSYV